MTKKLIEQRRKMVESHLRKTELVLRFEDDRGHNSIKALNVALYGTAHNEIPRHISRVVGETLFTLQRYLPYDFINSDTWRATLVASVGTDRLPKNEKRRAELLFDWMWFVLGHAQNRLVNMSMRASVDLGGVWATILRQRTAESAFEGSKVIAEVSSALIKYDAVTHRVRDDEEQQAATAADMAAHTCQAFNNKNYERVAKFACAASAYAVMYATDLPMPLGEYDALLRGMSDSRSFVKERAQKEVAECDSFSKPLPAGARTTAVELMAPVALLRKLLEIG